jgi:hypothetical protein
MANKAPVRDVKKIKFATIHHASVMPGAADKTMAVKRAKSYDAYHGSKSYAIETNGEYGFKYISYHFLIARNGYVLKTQHPKYVRYHATDNFRGAESHNLWGIAILLDGNFEVETPSAAQIEAAARVIANFNRQHRVRLQIKGHRETSLTGTDCPGKNMGLSTQTGSRLRRIIYRARQLTGSFIPKPPLDPGDSPNTVISMRDVIKWLRKVLFGR